jgi:hypothetical protein
MLIFITDVQVRHTLHVAPFPFSTSDRRSNLLLETKCFLLMNLEFQLHNNTACMFTKNVQCLSNWSSWDGKIIYVNQYRRTNKMKFLYPVY